MTSGFIYQTADYIRKIILRGGRVTMSWGVHRFVACEYQKMAALRFSVNGFLHRGYVYVCLNEGKDLFEVFTVKKDKVVAHETEVFIEDLVDTIDFMVEKNVSQLEYEKKVARAYRNF